MDVRWALSASSLVVLLGLALPVGAAWGIGDDRPLLGASALDPVDRQLDPALAPVDETLAPATRPLEDTTGPVMGSVQSLADDATAPAGAVTGALLGPAPPAAAEGAKHAEGEEASAPAGAGNAAAAPPDASTQTALFVPLATVAAAGAASVLRPEWSLRAARGAGRILHALGAAPALALFSRLEDKELEKHPLRAQLMLYLEGNPGARMQEVQQTLGVAWGTVVYHLGRLERARHVVSHKDGKARRFWVEADPQARTRAAASILRHDTPRAIADAVRQQPGIHQAKLAETLQILPATACKYLRRMTAEGLVQVEARDRRNLYFPTPRLDALAA